MAEVTFHHVKKAYGPVTVIRGSRPRHQGPRVHGAGRARRVRQVDGAADDRRAGGDHRRHDHRRPRGQRRPAQGPRHRDGLPELRALPAHDRAREPGVRPEDPQDAEGGDRPAGRRGGADPRHRPSSSTASPSSSRAASASASPSAAPSCASPPSSSSTSRSPTSTPSCACRCAPRSRSSSSGCKTTTVYVTHDQVEAMTMGHRIAVMNERQDPAGRHAAGGLRAAGQPLRGQLHRHAADELPPGHAGRRRRDGRRPPASALPVPAGAARAAAAGKDGPKSSSASGRRTSARPRRRGAAAAPCRSPPRSSSSSRWGTR